MGEGRRLPTQIVLATSAYTKFSPGSGNPGVCIPPSAHPPPQARRHHQHIPFVARPAEKRTKRLRRLKQRGPGRPRPPTGPGRVERRAEAGKTRPTLAGRAESARRAGAWREGRDDRGRGDASTELGPRLRGRRRPRPPPDHPHPHPGTSEENETGDKAPSPGRAELVRSGLPAPPPHGPARDSPGQS